MAAALQKPGFLGPMGVRIQTLSRRGSDLVGGLASKLHPDGRRREPALALVALGLLALSGLVAWVAMAELGVRFPAGSSPGTPPERAAHVQLVAGAGVAYAVDPTQGKVQPIDPRSLSDVGPAVHLTPPLGAAALDARGRLWVPVPARGQVASIRGARLAASLDVGAPHDSLQLTMAGQSVVVTDSTSGIVSLASAAAITTRVSLPTGAGAAAELLAPASTAGLSVPVLARSSHAVFVVDLAHSSVAPPIPLKGGGKVLAPQLLGTRIYVPDESKGNVIVYDMQIKKLRPRIPVTNLRGRLQAHLNGTQLWVSDQDNAAAVVVNADGTALPLGLAVHPTPAPRPAPTPRA